VLVLLSRRCHPRGLEIQYFESNFRKERGSKTWQRRQDLVEVAGTRTGHRHSHLL